VISVGRAPLFGRQGARGSGSFLDRKFGAHKSGAHPTSLVGLLPAEIQNFTTYGFGVSTESKNQALAKKFLASIAGAGVADVIRSKGMEAVVN
jgi:ABC-type molybdate transport system substrate-binding protein